MDIDPHGRHCEGLFPIDPPVPHQSEDYDVISEELKDCCSIAAASTGCYSAFGIGEDVLPRMEIAESYGEPLNRTPAARTKEAQPRRPLQEPSPQPGEEAQLFSLSRTREEALPESQTAAKPKITETKRKFGDKIVKCLNARPMGKGEISKYCSRFHGKDGCKAKSCKRRHKCDIVIKIDDNKRARTCDGDHKRCDHTGTVIEV